MRPAKLWCDTATADQARRLGVPTGFTASKLLWMKEREPENQLIARRVAARTGGEAGTRGVAAEDAALGASAGARRTPSRTGPTGAPPRPRKKRKKR